MQEPKVGKERQVKRDNHVQPEVIDDKILFRESSTLRLTSYLYGANIWTKFEEGALRISHIWSHL